MIDLFRGWNERSFPGWRAWGGRIALISLAWLFLRSLLMPDGSRAVVSDVPTLSAWILVTFLFVGWTVLLAKLSTSFDAYPWRAALAGWSRFLPLVLLTPVIDRLWYLGTGHVVKEAWISPNTFFGWVTVGWTKDGLFSLGLTVIVLTSVGFLGYLFRRQTIGWAQTVLAMAMATLFPWLVLAFPSFTAWSRLSSYGTTFAPANQVVDQAFTRAWNHSYWSYGYDRFLDVPSSSSEMGVGLLFAVFAWLGAASLLVPGIVRSPKGSWWQQITGLGVVIAPLAGGYISQFIAMPGRSWFVTVALFFVLFYEAVLLTILTNNVTSEGDQDDAWFVLILAFVGGWILGWAAFIGVLVFTILLRRAVSAPTVDRQVLWQTCLTVLVFFLGSWVAAGVSALFWSPAFVIGVFGLFGGITILCQAGTAIHVQRGADILGKRRSYREIALFTGVLWIVSLLCLWWGIGSFRFVWEVLTLGVLGPAIAWFFWQDARAHSLVLVIFPLLLGLLLHSGVFLP